MSRTAAFMWASINFFIAGVLFLCELNGIASAMIGAFYGGLGVGKR